MENLFELLRSKGIISILIGDEKYQEINGIEVSMPYLSGPTICQISSLLGFPVNYPWGGGAQSRWGYMDDLLDFCISNSKIEQLLAYLFAKERFVEKLQKLSPKEIEETYAKIRSVIVEKINGQLYFGGHKLSFLGKQFAVKPIDVTIEIDVPALKTIDSEYIKDIAARATVDIENTNYDSAITKCRTLLEEVFFYVIEKKGEAPSDSGDIGKLYNQVKTLHNMHQAKEADKRVNMLLSGLEKIITAISQMRNKGSDAHGLGSTRINIADYHCRLFVNASTMISDFILSVAERNASASMNQNEGIQ